MSNSKDAARITGYTIPGDAGATQVPFGVGPAAGETGALAPYPVPPSRHVTAEPPPGRRIVGHWESGEPAVEGLRFVKNRLYQMRAAKPLKTVLVASANPGEGKTVVALNLAASLARRCGRVLFVDGDMRRPDAGRIFGGRARPGLSGILQERHKLKDILLYVDVLKVYYLTAGLKSGDAMELLQGPGIQQLVEQVKPFEWVVIDSPPLGSFADAKCLLPVADAVLLVTRTGVTRRDDLVSAISAVGAVPLAGIVLNGKNDARRDAYYHGYYGRSVARARMAVETISDEPEGEL